MSTERKPKKQPPKARKARIDKATEPSEALEEAKGITPDQITYPSGEVVVDANGDTHEMPSDMLVQEQQAMSAFERRQAAYALRLGGATLDQIAKRLGVHIQTVHVYLSEAMKELNTENAQMLRNVYGRRLEMLIQRHWPQALQGDPQATQIVLSIMDRQFRLYGFDRPDEAEQMDNANEIVVLSKTTTKDEFVAAMQRARAQIQKVAG